MYIRRLAIIYKALLINQQQIKLHQNHLNSHLIAPHRHTHGSRCRMKNNSNGYCGSGAGTRPCPFLHLKRWPKIHGCFDFGFVITKGFTVKIRWLRMHRRRCSDVGSKNSWQMSACGWAMPCGSSKPTVCHEYVLRPLELYKIENVSMFWELLCNNYINNIIIKCTIDFNDIAPDLYILILFVYKCI